MTPTPEQVAEARGLLYEPLSVASLSDIQGAAHKVAGRDQQVYEALVDALEALQRPARLGEQPPRPGERPGPYRLVTLDQIRIEPTRWLWEQRLPLGTLTILAGRGGVGKGTLTAELAARVSRGDLKGDRFGVPGHVLILSAEDRSTLWAARLKAASADLTRVSVLTIPDGVDERDLVLPDDRETLAKAISDSGAVLVVIDPLNAHLADRIDGHRDHNIRRALGPLMRVADDTGAAILAIAHLNKGQGDALNRVIGSVGIVNAARAVLVVAPPADGDDGDRVVALAKANLGPPASSLRFRLEPRTIHGDDEPVPTVGIRWLGEDPASADELLAPADKEAVNAGDWLKDLLADGKKVPCKDVERLAEENGITRASLYRAKKRIRVLTTRDNSSQGRPSTWSLPFVSPGLRRNPARRNPEAEEGFRLIPELETKPREVEDAVQVVLAASSGSTVVQ